MKEISRQNIVLSTVAVIMLVLILTIGFFAIPVGITLCYLTFQSYTLFKIKKYRML